jgi:hypothetical protein
VQWRATNRNLPGYVTAGAQRLKYKDAGEHFNPVEFSRTLPNEIQ